MWTFKGLESNNAGMYYSGYFLFDPDNTYISVYEATGRMGHVMSQGQYSFVRDEINPRLILFDPTIDKVDEFSISIDFNSMSSFTLTLGTTNLNYSRCDIDMLQLLAGLLNNEGIAFYKLGKYQEAINLYDNALRVDPNYTLAQNNKELALDRLSKEKSYYHETKPRGTMPKGWKPTSYYEDVNSLINKGSALVNLGEYQEAIEYI